MDTAPAPGIAAFGSTRNQDMVHRVALAAQGLRVTVLTHGAALQSLRLDGVAHDLTLGSDHLADYEDAMRYHGTIVGPLANRIRNARAVIAGQTCHFPANEGPNTLHSGPTGTHARIWHILDATDDDCRLGLTLAAEDGGLPGNRQITARWQILPQATLRLTIFGTTDAPTLMNLTSHSYWNLDGSGSWEGHQLQVMADEWLPTDEAGLPTGEMRPATGAMDFRQPRVIRPQEPPLDDCFCLTPARRAVTPAARLIGKSGVSLQLATTEPGLQVYDGRAAVRPGRAAFEGIALEAQGWPDAPNQPGFPSVLVTPDAPYHAITEWRFSRG